MNLLLLFGLTLLFTVIISFIFIRIRIPQVIGYILIGIFLGVSGIQLFNETLISHLVLITYFALALIGFTIGGELRWARLKRFGVSILFITFFECIFSTLIVFLVVYFTTKNLPLALLLGGLSAATAPGGTMNVIQECKARGPLTSTLYGVVGADDAFAIILFAFLAGISKVLVGATNTVQWMTIIGHVLLDVGGALLLGILLGLFFSIWMLYIRSTDVRHLLTLIAIFICAGLSIALHVSLILSSMAMGILVANIRPHRSRSCFVSLHYLSTPIYMLFFVLIGARLNISVLMQMGSVGVIYFVFRSMGKYLGAFTGAFLAKTSPVIRRNIGFCLFSQAGVAIGLAISTDIEFSTSTLQANQLGATIVTIITATTLIFQIIGPIMTKHALVCAKEVH